MSNVSVREIVFSTKHAVHLQDLPLSDIDCDKVFTRIFEASRQYTMTAKEVMFFLYCAVRYVVENDVPGDFVECGVWRGGSALIAALTFAELGDHSRQFHLYDTFEGMTAPTSVDVDVAGGRASDYISQYGDDGRWCYASLLSVQATFASHGFDERRVHFVKGDVLDTLKSELPPAISLLRLDTDWYESTKFELERLYPRLVKGGSLIADDYGHWNGSRLAVDEYFQSRPRPLLIRISSGVRVAIKV